MKVTLAGINDENKIVFIKLSTDDGCVSSTGEVYRVADFNAEVEGYADSIWYEVESCIEDCPYGFLLRINENAVDRYAEESIYEDNIVIEEDNMVLMWEEAGQIDALDNYKELKNMFGEDIADAIMLIRKLHLKSYPHSIREAEERMRVIDSIAREKRIPRTPEEAYERNKDMWRY